MRTISELLPLQETPSIHWPDRDLVAACLSGDERAWAAIIAKYKNLVYSAPVRYRMRPEDAADLFQSVWTDLFSELPNLRDVDALRSWLIKVALNKCYQWKRKQVREPNGETDKHVGEIPDPQPLFPALKEDFDQQQKLRRAIASLPPRCQMMIQRLFFSDPPLPYADVARELGLATGSIGFIRGRCLRKLRHALEQEGL